MLTIAILATVGLAGTGMIGSDEDIRSYLEIRAPRSVSVAPDGRVYAIDWPDGVNQLYMREAGETSWNRLTDFEDGVSSYDLSPDGTAVLVEASAGGSEQDDLHLVDAATGRMRTLREDPDVVFGFQCWLRDASGFIYRANDDSPTDFHLYRHDLETGTITRILGESGSWSARDVSDDGTRVLVSRYHSASHAEVYELEASSGKLRSISLGEGETYNSPVGYMPGEQSVLLISDFQDGVRRLYVRDLGTGETRKPLPDLDPYDLDWGAALSDDRMHLCVVANRDGYGEPRVVELPSFATVEFPLDQPGVVSGVEFEGDRLVFNLSNARTPSIAHAWTIGSDTIEPLVEADAPIDVSTFPLPELVHYPTFDDRLIPAFMTLPEGEREGPIPFVIIFHGGPESQHRPTFDRWAQYLVANGFGVLEPNVRGSTGYGRAFHTLDNGARRWDSVRDGVAAAQWLIDQGYAEAGRIGAYGGSYGGFMSVAVILEAPDLFGCSIDVVGIVNFETFLERTGEYRRALREAEYGSLDDREMLREISPIHRADEIEVPMLIAHGLNDPRVPIDEAIQLASRLQARGLDPEIVQFHDEGHGFRKLANRVVFYERAARFLKRHLVD